MIEQLMMAFDMAGFVSVDKELPPDGKEVFIGLFWKGHMVWETAGYRVGCMWFMQYKPPTSFAPVEARWKAIYHDVSVLKRLGITLKEKR